MWQHAKARAKKENFAFTITEEYLAALIPKFCPVLGIKLDGSIVDSRPSIDKIIPELGYVPGNVAVISFRANSIKRNATAFELKAVSDWTTNQILRVKEEMNV
jgi:hypothetical protein